MGRTLAELQVDHVGSVFHQTDHFAEIIVRRPLGVTANAENVTAVVAREKGDATLADEKTGKQIIFFACLEIAAAQAWSTEDTWIAQGLEWTTLGQEGCDGAMRSIRVQHIIPKTLKG